MAIRSGDHKSSEFPSLPCHESALAMRERADHRRVFNLMSRKQRSTVGNFLSVHFRKRPERKPVTDHFLVPRMQVFRVPGIVDGHGHSRVGDRQRLEHALAHFSPAFKPLTRKVRQLHPRKRKISLTPTLTPFPDKLRKLFGIKHALFRSSCIGLSLIPHRTADSVPEQRCDLSIKTTPRPRLNPTGRKRHPQFNLRSPHRQHDQTHGAFQLLQQIFSEKIRSPRKARNNRRAANLPPPPAPLLRIRPPSPIYRTERKRAKVAV